MLEDMLGLVVVLLGAFVIKFTGINRLDACLSIFVAIFIFINAMKGLNKILDLFLEKIPDGIFIEEIKKHLLEIENIHDVHHLHIWSIDCINNFATMHIVVNNNDAKTVKRLVREELKGHGISHVTIEIEKFNEKCDEVDCIIETNTDINSHHHHH